MRVYCTAANVNYADLDIKTRNCKISKNYKMHLRKPARPSADALTIIQ